MQLEAYTNAQSLPVFMGYVNDYQITVKEAVATAYASALAGITACPPITIDIIFILWQLFCLCSTPELGSTDGQPDIEESSTTIISVVPITCMSAL
jgi:hypothetical protein